MELTQIETIQRPASLAQEDPRLTRQARAIDSLFREKFILSNADLSNVALRYSARIHELRKIGRDIRIVGRDREVGLVTYRYYPA